MLSKGQMQLVAEAEEILRSIPRGITTEALVNALAKRLNRPLHERVVVQTLRQVPQRFSSDEAGRWLLRVSEEPAVMTVRSEEPAPTETPAISTLQVGCYVIFDLEATGQRVGSPATEIIQIAAQKWLDGQFHSAWMTFVKPVRDVPERIINLTQIKPEELRDAPVIQEALPAFFAYIGDLPLIAHNGSSYDGPLLHETCKRLHIPLPASFLVLDTLPLARTLLPTLGEHRVEALANHFDCALPDAHRADVDVAMLAGIVQGLEQLMQTEPGGNAVYELLRRARDPWSQILRPPARSASLHEILSTFGAQITPLLPERQPVSQATLDTSLIEETFQQAEMLGRGRRETQLELARITANAIREGNIAVIEAGTGIGKSQGYLIPAALAARSTGLPVAISTFTRVLQAQLIARELPFVKQLAPSLTYAQLQGRANYLSLTRLAEELEEALNEERLYPARAWMLAMLTRFAATSAHGNLEELGGFPQALDSYLATDGATLQVLSSVSSNLEDRPGHEVTVEFYQRARENAERADLVVINHALLFRNLADPTGTTEPDEVAFAGTLICDEAHNLEAAATTALERRVEERVLRRILRGIYQPRAQGSLVNVCRSRLKLPAADASLQALTTAVDASQAALDGLAQRLHNYVDRQVVTARANRERYGTRVRIERGALTAIGGPDLKDTADTLGRTLIEVRNALQSLIQQIEDTGTRDEAPAQIKRRQRLRRLARSFQRDLRGLLENYTWFWQFREASNYVHIVEIEPLEEVKLGQERTSGLRAPVAISTVPINVGPLLWQRLWSLLRSAICTSATFTVHGQGFDFFLHRVGLEQERIVAAAPDRQLITRELPHAFDYHNNALLMLPNDLPAPRDSNLKYHFPAAVADLLGRFIPFFEGKTLGLFTANARRDFVYETLVDRLVELGFPLLCQGQRGLQRLIDEFREIEHSSLLGSRTLWEGVDIEGSSLSYVFLEKLPYPSLGDPVEAARMSAVENAGGNAFYDYLLPRMIIVLKQGFGRLIRSARDKGAVILLDKRLRNSLYRNEVLCSLPDPTIGYESDTGLFQHIAEWMEIPFDPADLPQPTVPDIQRVLEEQQLPGSIVNEADFEQQARPRLLAAQQAIWGHDIFRPGQEEIMRDVLAGKDVLTLLPTGAGKSRTYQLPALLRPGLTLIISPLIALIRDQVEKLREVPGLTCVAALISGVDAASQEEILRQAANGQIKLLYISPERLRDPRFRYYLDRLPIVQLVVDEAHCIATWGHDFRPDFREISQLLRTHRSNLPVHALTATAPRQVQDEILSTLEMGTNRPLEIRRGDFLRPNLIFRVFTVDSDSDRNTTTLGIVHQIVRNEEKGGAGIVYVATRRQATQLANMLRNHNIAAQAYHAGLPTPERHQIQERFMQGDLDVVVATSAFGMGVDKAEIRFVLHYDHPNSLEAYIQEAGRAGRDNKEAYAILLYHRQTSRTTRFIARKNIPTREALASFYQALRDPGLDDGLGVVLPDGNTLCAADTPGQLAGIEPTLARILLYAFEEASLVERGADCTLEATLLLNQSVEDIVNALPDATARAQIEQLLRTLGAMPDRQVTYQAIQVYLETGLDPRLIDPLLVELAERDLLLYRSYRRGLTFKLIHSDQPGIMRAALRSIEQNYERRYQIFEDRLQAMLDYIWHRIGQNRCRSAELINFLTGDTSVAPCGKCDLCSPDGSNLPWSPGVRLYSEKPSLDVRLAILSAVRDHNKFFARGTIEMMLLGIPQKRYADDTRKISKTAQASDHYNELGQHKIKPEVVKRTFDVLIEGGYLELTERTLRDGTTTYQAVMITRKGRDALAGGIALPEPHQPDEVLS